MCREELSETTHPADVIAEFLFERVDDVVRRLRRVDVFSWEQVVSRSNLELLERLGERFTAAEQSSC